jgi:hypothetical protein
VSRFIPFYFMKRNGVGLSGMSPGFSSHTQHTPRFRGAWGQSHDTPSVSEHSGVSSLAPWAGLGCGVDVST